MGYNLLQSESCYLRLVEVAPLVASAFGILVACAVLIGWQFDIALLRSIVPRQPQMVPNTALCFILAGFSLWLLHTQTRRRWKHAATLCAGLLVLISLLTLTEYLSGLDLRIDRLLFAGKLQTGQPFQGRPSPHTASNFVLLGSSLLLLTARKSWFRTVSQYLAVTVALGALLAIVGYSYRVAFLYRISPSTGMALHTAITFLVLGLGCVAAQARHGITLLLLSDTAGGMMARYLMPAAGLLPIIFGGLILLGQRLGFYETAFGMALCVIMSVLVLSILIWRNARTLYRLDVDRQHAEIELRKAKDDLEKRVEQRTDELSKINRALQSEMADRERSELARLQLLRQLVNTQEEERRRISRELHDRMGQHLSALMLGIRTMKSSCRDQSACDDLQRLENLTNQLAQKVHHLAWELRPASLDDFGLDTALSSFLEKWSEGSGIQVAFQTNSSDKPRLPSPVETTVYRVIQEALTNVVKHADASRVDVMLEQHGSQVLATVADNGKGFDPDALRSERGISENLGLAGMRERIALVGGIFDIESEVNVGTTLVMRIPLSQREGIPR